MEQPLSILEQICFSTTRIECEQANGQKVTGTGFFFAFHLDGGMHIPVIITNKHVVSRMNKGKFLFTEADDQGLPIRSKHFPIVFETDFEKMWTFHPDPQVDLCAMPIGMLINAANLIKRRLFYKTLDESIVPNASQLSDLDVVEDIFMIGYPNGIWDSSNNMPIVRKGTTATHPNLNYNGKSEFLIDAACFPGSSGSPVISFSKGGYTSKNGTVNFGSPRLYFLGVLYAGPQHTATGDIHVVNVPAIQRPMAISMIPNNLGLIIKASCILDFKDIFTPKDK